MEETKKKPLRTKTEKEVIFTIIAFLIIAIFFLAPAPSGLSADGMKVLGIFIGILFCG